MGEQVDNTVSKENLLRRMQAGWDELHAFIDTLTDEQLTKSTDAAGWTVKDHVMHLAVWEDGINGSLERKPRWQLMGVDQTTWLTGFNETNTMIQEKYRDLPMNKVREYFQQVHADLVKKVEASSEEDLMLPYNHYDKTSNEKLAIFWFIAGNTFGHYEDHIPWMKAIIEKD